MKLYLARHAKAKKRSRWEAADPLRPLTKAGRRQAQGLLTLLQDDRLERIVSSPHLRCRETVAPLANARGLPLEVDERLAEGEDPTKALELVRELGAGPALLCSHGDVIPLLLCELEERGLELRGELRCEKGSIWLLEGDGGEPLRASYLPPPDKERTAAPPEPEEDGDAEELRVAVLDLGSTSFTLLVAETTPAGQLVPVLRERSMLRLGAAMAGGGPVPEEVVARAVKAARALRKQAVAARAERLLPVGTAALRDPANGPVLARRLGKALDAPVRVLTGEEEARLMFAAFRRRVGLGEGRALGVDLGGGSVELAIGDARDVVWETTLPLGVVRLHGELVRSDPMAPEEAELLRQRVRECLAPLRAKLARLAPRVCIAAGGTVGALARRVVARRELPPEAPVNRLFVPAEELRQLTAELLRSTHEERLRMSSLSARRADLIPTGALVLSTLADELALSGCTVSDWGLREGVILEHLGLASADRPARA